MKHDLWRQAFLYIKEYQRHQRLEATNRVNLFLDQAVLQAPDQWFYWFNVQERWKTGVPEKPDFISKKSELAG